MAVKVVNGQVTAANTNTDGTTGAYVTLYTAPASGAQVDKIVLKATGVTTAGMVRLFITAGGSTRLVEEIAVTAQPSPGASTKTYSAEFRPTNFYLGNAAVLLASTHNAEVINVETFVREF